MDNQQQPPVVNQEPVATNQKGPSSFLTILLSILLILACVIAGFFAYQTQKLVVDLREMQVEQTPQPDQSNQQQDEEWRMFENKSLGFSFSLAPFLKYPTNLDPSESNMFSNRMNLSGPLEIAGKDILLESTVYRDIDQNSGDKVKTSLTTEIGDSVKQPFQPIGSIKKLLNLRNGGAIFEESPLDDKEATYLIAIWENDSNVHVLKMFAMSEVLNKSKEDFIKMAESYKFEELATVCTMDAKICPDGSAVGRSGPNCEFAPCPTPKS